MVLIAVKRPTAANAPATSEENQTPMEAYTVTVPDGSDAYSTVVAFLARKNLPVGSEVYALDLSKVAASVLHYRLDTQWTKL